VTTTSPSRPRTGSAEPLDVARLRADFPLLSRRLPGDVPLVYLDSANTSQKPQVVIDAIARHYREHNANVARAMHTVGAEATAAYEDARATVAGFIGAARADEVVFTKNASEALNLAAYTLTTGLGPGDEIVVTEMEHHSNLVPWQLACERTGARLRWFGLTDDGRLDLAAARRDGLVNEHTRVVSLAHVSNSLGTVNPVADIAAWAHAVGSRGAGATVVVDASQAVPQMPVDVASLGADLLAFTGHKLLGPTGVGVLWGRFDLLAALPPFLGGGEMIEIVRMSGSTFAPPPHRFEAGTPPIAQAVGLAAAIGYLQQVGMTAVAEHERQITGYALTALAEVPGLTVLGPTDNIDRGGAVSFSLADVHPHDVAQMLDGRGIAVRAGHHCARPVHERFGIQSTTRASFYLYTTTSEVDALVDGLLATERFFAR